uniref:Reverse transcriptase domain-containing protein n=1 Tax=Tanacetum cinerariifolium TaxID=118510 RepID=A0A6L2L9X2_TANCI|nr:reverse transcriptase domain-containing protein [Tanacetum cinerariifolium]GEU99004.1 reverse transcriptase domain-containing protein [Tanacetum cinerariifolium]
MSTSSTHHQSLVDARSETHPLILERGSYIPWASQFRHHLNKKRETRKPERPKTEDDLTGDDLKKYEADIEAMNLILISIPNDIYNSIDSEDFDALLDEDSEILHSIEGTILEEKLFAKFDEFMAMTTDENFESESNTKEPPFEKITFNTDYKIKTSLEEPTTDLELKPLPDNLEYAFLE